MLLYFYRYTLLVGKPPFETESLKDTYQRIKRNEYHIPSHINPEARSLIKRLLRSDPSSRPTAGDILHDPFLTAGFIPAKLPPRYMYIVNTFMYSPFDKMFVGSAVFINCDVSSFNSSLTTAPHFKNAHLPPSSARHPLAQVNSLVTETNVAARKVAATPVLADGEYEVIVFYYNCI